MKANDLSQFTFKLVGYGHYRVTYVTKRDDYYVAVVTDMPLIDATKNAEYAKLVDIKRLRDLVKRTGTHYRYNGERI